MITVPKLLAFASSRAPNIPAQAAALEAARQQSSIDTPRRLAAFLGQIAKETDWLTALSENLNYRTPERLDALFKNVRSIDHAARLIKAGPEAIANCVYAYRGGNGDEASGDGWKYRGSGYIHLTFKNNYRAYGIKIGMDLVSRPELALEYESAALIAVKYWDANNCSHYADQGDIEEITERVNGPALLGLKERRAATARALEIWN